MMSYDPQQSFGAAATNNCRDCNTVLTKNELKYKTLKCNRCYNGSKGSTQRCSECPKFLLKPEMDWTERPRVCGDCWSV